ncbi:MAG: hypothetical protein GYB31_13195 [Bacteroidetes bacterium]|nr:hypothetical protein [Bacteroidota bacterium]
MKRSLLDQVLHKDRFIGRSFIKAETPRREQLMKFREWANRQTLEKRQQTARQLTASAAFSIPEEDGFLFVAKSDFPEIPEMISQARAITASQDPEALRRNKKEQLLTGLLKKQELSLDSPFVKFVLREEIAATAANYLGVMPVLGRIDVWYSKASTELSNSQLHHCDFESMRQLKLFIYVTEVTDKTGPLVVMKASDSERVRNQIHYRYGQKVKDEIIDPLVAPDQLFKAVGSPGAMVFGDTSRCFHYGSRVAGESESRTVIMVQFLRPQAFSLPLKMIGNSPYAWLSKPDLPAYQRQLLGAE